ncbi:hypothetical protein I5907_17165 [Panacibacter sp. DH6]|uniref:Glycerophosphoryl diester phosphodiesterase membrane domain-containing protein n=1 Tax=Panacibacter microcysteis TaxID=2793269 RepID=A0A931GZ12_9BACT|nr:hypothetical protein [Panacibacter microcysteis]MBG9377972.1 hypothetical protein [Panacibacter microcysteis]
MDQQKVQLRKLRDFGENFSDTFQFIRQEFKPLMLSFILVSGVFMLVTAIVSGLYQKTAFGFLDQLETGVFTPRTFSDTFNSVYLLMILFSMLSIIAMQTVAAIYMKHRERFGESPSMQDVWSGFTRFFPKVFFYAIPVYLLIIIGFFFCILPGIYLAIVFTPFVFVVVDEERSFGDAFSRCFDIIKENFWISLGIYFVAYLIYAVFAGVIGVFVGLFAGVGSYFTTRELSTTAAWVMSVLNVVQYIFYVIFFVSVGLHYYNLVEAKDGTGLAKRLEGLGGNSNVNDNIEEQY